MSALAPMNKEAVDLVIKTTERMRDELVPKLKELEAECNKLEREQYPELAERCQGLSLKLYELVEIIEDYLPEAPRLSDSETEEMQDKIGPFVGASEILRDADARFVFRELVSCLFDNAENLRAGDNDRNMRPRLLAPYALLAYVAGALSNPESFQGLIFQPIFSPVNPKLLA